MSYHLTSKKYKPAKVLAAPKKATIKKGAMPHLKGRKK